MRATCKICQLRQELTKTNLTKFKMRVINTVFILNKRPGALQFTRSNEAKCGHNYIYLSILYGYFGLVEYPIWHLGNFYPIKGRGWRLLERAFIGIDTVFPDKFN